MRFYIFAVLIALAMAQKPGGNTGPPNNGGNTGPPNNGGGNTGRPNNGGNNGPPNNGGNNGPPHGEPFSCLSSADKEAGKTCMQQEKRPLRFLRANVNSGNINSCPPTCLLQQLKAIDSSNHVNTEALVAVINRANLTESQKISATNILETCLADSTTDGSTDVNGLSTPAPNQNKGTAGPGGKNQNGKGSTGQNTKGKGTNIGHQRGGYWQSHDDENTEVGSDSGESNESTTNAPNQNTGTTGQGGKNQHGKNQKGKGQKGKKAKGKRPQTGQNQDQNGQSQDDENTEVGSDSGESNDSTTIAPNQSNGGGKKQNGKGTKEGNQNGQGPSGGRGPPPNMTPECQASARGVDCLGKALTANDCGPPQGPNGHGQKGRQ